MQRLEAINFVKKIQNLCDEINVKAVVLRRHTITGRNGYQIRLSAPCIKRVKEIYEAAKADGLSVAVDNGALIIFRTKE